MMASALSRDRVDCASRGGPFFSFLPERIFSLSFISTKACFVNPAVESGSTNQAKNTGRKTGHYKPGQTPAAKRADQYFRLKLMRFQCQMNQVKAMQDKASSVSKILDHTQRPGLDQLWMA